jgi:hypothetical protein
MSREEQDISYFHSQKGDITRYVHWDKIKHKYPDIVQAMKAVENANILLDNEVNKLETW